MHSASLEFPILCQYHIIVIIRLLFIPPIFLVWWLPYIFLFAVSFLFIFGSYVTRIASEFLILLHKIQVRDQQEAPTTCQPVSMDKRLGGARSDLNTLPGKVIPSSMDNPTATAQSLNLWPNHYTDWNNRLPILLYWLGRKEEER